MIDYDHIACPTLVNYFFQPLRSGAIIKCELGSRSTAVRPWNQAANSGTRGPGVVSRISDGTGVPEAQSRHLLAFPPEVGEEKIDLWPREEKVRSPLPEFRAVEAEYAPPRPADKNLLLFHDRGL